MVWGEQLPTDKKCHSIYIFLAFWPCRGMPRKVMNVSYFAESKGVVGCHYSRCLALKVRDSKRFLN